MKVRRRTAEEQARTVFRPDDLRCVVPRYFRDEAGRPVQLMPFHKEVLGLLGQGGRRVILLPTEHGKSSLLNVFYPILSLIEDRNAAHLIVCANDREAQRWLDQVKFHLTQNTELLQDFPWLRKGKKWGAHEIMIAGRDTQNANPSVSAMGIWSNDLKGRRGKLSADDLEGQRTSASPLERRRLYDKVNQELIRNVEDPAFGFRRPLLAVAGTPFDVDSLYFRLIRKGWEVYKRPYKNGEKMLWPAKQQKIMELKATLSKIEFAIAMELDPTAGDPNVMSADQLKAMAKIENSGFNEKEYRVTLVSLDPAGGSRNAFTDYAGLAVVRIKWPPQDPYPYVEVVRAMRFSGGVLQQIQTAKMLSDEYDAPVVFEVNGQQATTYTQLFRQYYPDLRLLKHWTSKENKWESYMGFTIAKDLLRENHLKVLEEGEGADTFYEEMRDLGTTRRGYHDHICAAVWFAVYWAYRARQGRVKLKPQDEQESPRVTSQYGWRGYSSGQVAHNVIDLRPWRTPLEEPPPPPRKRPLPGV